MQLNALNRVDPPPRFPGRPARLARATATGLLAALVLVAVSRAAPVQAVGEVGRTTRHGGSATRVRRLTPVATTWERTRSPGACVIVSTGTAAFVAC